MTADHRDDEAAWILARERGLPAPSISEERAARYERLQALLADLPESPVSPPDGWEERMHRALEAGASGPASDTRADGAQPGTRLAAVRRRWRTVTMVAGAALVLIIVLAVRHSPSAPAAPAIAFAVERAAPDLLGPAPGSSTRPRSGDQLVVRAIGNQHAELRVYDDAGVEQARCAASGPGCRLERTGDEITLILTMAVHTDHVLRAFVFTPPLGTPPEGLAADITAAEHAAIAVTQLELR